MALTVLNGPYSQDAETLLHARVPPPKPALLPTAVERTWNRYASQGHILALTVLYVLALTVLYLVLTVLYLALTVLYVPCSQDAETLLHARTPASLLCNF